LGQRLARYRLNRDQTQAALADESGISLRTLIRLENGQPVQFTNLIRVLRALGLLANLDAVVPEPAVSPVQQVRQRGRVRKRASGQPVQADRSERWSWEEAE
jgi:transcriptional regulator with XRE-family HTH domain